MKCNLTLVTLTPEQVSQAKEANGKRRRITHALVCGPYGQIFGTEKQCLKYFEVWDPAYRFEVSPGKYKSMFPRLFDEAVKTDKFDIIDYTTTPNLVGKLFETSDRAKSQTKARTDSGARSKSTSKTPVSTKTVKRRGFLSQLFSR